MNYQALTSKTLPGTLLSLSLHGWWLMENFSPIASYPQPWKIVILRTYKHSDALDRFVSYRNVKLRDTAWENTHGCFTPWLNGDKIGGIKCAYGHYLSQGLSRCVNPHGPKVSRGVLIPACPKERAGPASPEVPELLAGVRVSGNEMPPCLGEDGLMRVMWLWWSVSVKHDFLCRHFPFAIIRCSNYPLMLDIQNQQRQYFQWWQGVWKCEHWQPLAICPQPQKHWCSH